jgi:hypothetical protein
MERNNMAKARHDGMRLVERSRSKGINSHLTWVYKQGGKYAGIDRNFDVMDNKYYCFEGKLGQGEGCDTVWYPDLKLARNIVQRYLNDEIPNIPARSDIKEGLK